MVQDMSRVVFGAFSVIALVVLALHLNVREFAVHLAVDVELALLVGA